MIDKVKKFEGLVAVFSPDRGSAVKIEDQLDLTTTELADVQSFSESGWWIMSEAMELPEQRHVYRDDTGHVLIEGHYLTLRTNPDMISDNIERLAEDYGLEVKRTLGLRRDMFQVAPVVTGAERPDLLEVCKKLEQDERVKWADPSFIEAIGRRSFTNDE